MKLWQHAVSDLTFFRVWEGEVLKLRLKNYKRAWKSERDSISKLRPCMGKDSGIRNNIVFLGTLYIVSYC